MRKMKYRLSKDPEVKKLLKVKSIDNKTLIDNLSITKLIVLLTFFRTHFRKLFRYENKSLDKRSVYNIDRNKISNTVFDNDTYKYEIIQLVGIWNNIFQHEDINSDLGKLIVGSSKNPLLIDFVNAEVGYIMNKYTTVLKDYLSDITDKDLQRHIDNLVVLCAVCELLWIYFNTIKDEELYQMYTKERLRTIKSFITKFKNRIPYIFKDLTGRDNVTEFKIKSVLEALASTKYIIKGGTDVNI